MSSLSDILAACLFSFLSRGLLSEAVLALEAEVLRNDSNSDAWHLLGATHAENDDDRQVGDALPSLLLDA